ncbi:MAG: hypothetical protein H0V83_14645 [Rubrobacter sp.]|nr:hypothetical protein [Rubrobacter sp.]
MSAPGASKNPLSVVEYWLPVLELLTTTVTALPYRGLLPLDRSRDRLLCQPRHAQQG